MTDERKEQIDKEIDEWYSCIKAKPGVDVVSPDIMKALMYSAEKRMEEWQKLPEVIAQAEKVKYFFNLWTAKNKWIWTCYDEITCSNCGFTHKDEFYMFLDTEKYSENGFPYCPACGSKMNGFQPDGHWLKENNNE